MDSVDVLVVDALKVELEEIHAVASKRAPGERGVARWEERHVETHPYTYGRYEGSDGVTFTLALARPTRMGLLATVPVISALAARLRPKCLAMTGVCAGSPAETTLGDVVVAELAYSCEEGKRTENAFLADPRQTRLPEWMVRAAQDLSVEHLPSFRGPSAERAKTWVLKQLLDGRDFREHLAFARYFPDDETWKAAKRELEADGLIAFRSKGWALTAAGRTDILRRLDDVVGGPTTMPFRVVVAPMATGSVVVRDGRTWETLVQNVRTIAALEMEAAGIAQVAWSRSIPWIVAKGVADHADPRKGDHFKRFAARASAEVLLELLTTLAAPLGLGLAPLVGRGLIGWTAEDVAAASTTSDPPGDDAPLDEHEIVDVLTLRSGRLRDLQRDFAGLGRVFDAWLIAGHRKRREGAARVFWIAGHPGTHRGKALLAVLSRSATHPRAVFDARRDVGLAVAAIEYLTLAPPTLQPAIVALDLTDAPDGCWRDVRDALRGQAILGALSRGHAFPLLVVAGTAAQEQRACDVLKSLTEIDSHDVKGNRAPSPYSYAGAHGLASHSLGADDILYQGLPNTSPDLFGRENDLNMLRQKWSSEKTRILSIVAPGGVGKSALVNHWLREMREPREYDRRPRKLIAWSFYSQGTRDNLVSADAFIIEALRWFGDEEAAKQSADVRAGLLADHVRDHHSLVILDGVEPLQYPLSARDVGGQLTDSSMRVFLEALAAPGWRGLCLLTTRVPLTDLQSDGRDLDGVAQWDLTNLDERAGASLLRHVIGTGAELDERELRSAIRDVAGHALAVNLLGRYVRDVHAGRLSGRHELQRLAVAVDDGGHARRIMETYALWLERYNCAAELGVLDIVGLFDRPASPEAIAAIKADVEAAGTELGEVRGPEWNRAVEKLRRMGLLNAETPGRPDELDAHPLVREHFRDRLRTGDAERWREGNRALFEYYGRRAPYRPDTASDMNLLYAAVNHGCVIGLHQQVYDEVIVPRVWRTVRDSFSTRSLGMTGSEVVALSHFFQPSRWDELRDMPLTLGARLGVLSSAGLRLRQLGRLREARATCGAVFAAVDQAIDSGTPLNDSHLRDAAYAGSLNCELLVIAGALDEPRAGDTAAAEAVARRAIAFGDRCGDAYFRMYPRTCLAEVEFMRGDFDRAGAWFAEARAVEGSDTPFLYSQNLFRYGYYLIETGRAAQVLDSARSEGWGLNGRRSSRLSYAIRHLVIAAAKRSLLEVDGVDADLFAEAKAVMDQAIVGLRGVGYIDYVVRGLLERAHLLRVGRRTDDYAKALDDLSHCAVACERADMRVLAADAELQRVALFLDYWPTMSDQVRTAATGALRTATELVTSLGYGRRRDMLDELRRRAHAAGIGRVVQNPGTRLSKAAKPGDRCR